MNVARKYPWTRVLVVAFLASTGLLNCQLKAPASGGGASSASTIPTSVFKPTKLQLTGPSPVGNNVPTVVQGACTKFVVSAVDDSGSTGTLNSSINVLATTGLGFSNMYTDSGCTQIAQSILIPSAKTSTQTFYLMDSINESLQFSLQDDTALLAAATQTLEVTNSVVKIVGGFGSHWCALMANGDVRCWGSNSSGQLGDGTLNNSPTTMVQVKTATKFSDIGFLGVNHSCAIDTNSSVWCWGDNSTGELGSPTTGYTAVKAQIQVPVSKVVARSGSTCAMTTDGRMACWGSPTSTTNNFFSFGDRGGQANMTSIPQWVGGSTTPLTGVIDIGAQGALLGTGSFFSWSGQAVTGQTINVPFMPTNAEGLKLKGGAIVLQDETTLWFKGNTNMQPYTYQFYSINGVKDFDGQGCVIDSNNVVTCFPAVSVTTTPVTTSGTVYSFNSTPSAPTTTGTPNNPTNFGAVATQLAPIPDGAGACALLNTVLPNGKSGNSQIACNDTNVQTQINIHPTSLHLSLTTALAPGACYAATVSRTYNGSSVPFNNGTQLWFFTSVAGPVVPAKIYSDASCTQTFAGGSATISGTPSTFTFYYTGTQVAPYQSIIAVEAKEMNPATGTVAVPGPPALYNLTAPSSGTICEVNTTDGACTPVTFQLRDLANNMAENDSNVLFSIGINITNPALTGPVLPFYADANCQVPVYTAQTQYYGSSLTGSTYTSGTHTYVGTLNMDMGGINTMTIYYKHPIANSTLTYNVNFATLPYGWSGNALGNYQLVYTDIFTQCVSMDGGG